MATIYPAQIDNTSSLPTVVDNQTPVKAININVLRDAIVAIESELGVNPAGTYTTVRTRLDTLEAIIDSGGGGGGGGGGNVVVVGTPAVGQAIIWNGSAWIPSSDFGSQTIQTTGQLLCGPLLGTSITSGLFEMMGKLVASAISTAYPSGPGQGIIYFDSTQNLFLVSQNGSSYSPLVLNNTSTNFQTTGQVNSGPLLATSVTAGLGILNGKLLVNAVSASTLSNAGQGALYFDSTQNLFLVSQNGSSFYPLVLNNTSQNFQTSGQINSGPLLSTSISTGLFTLNGKLLANAIDDGSLSDSGQGIIYFDGYTNQFLVSQNGGAYVPLIGGSEVNVTVVTANYTTGQDDTFISIGTLTSSITITLQASPSTGKVFYIKDANASAATHPITISGNGNNIDGASTLNLYTNYASVTIFYNGSKWCII